MAPGRIEQAHAPAFSYPSADIHTVCWRRFYETHNPVPVRMPPVRPLFPKRIGHCLAPQNAVPMTQRPGGIQFSGCSGIDLPLPGKGPAPASALRSQNRRPAEHAPKGSAAGGAFCFAGTCGYIDRLQAVGRKVQASSASPRAARTISPTPFRIMEGR